MPRKRTQGSKGRLQRVSIRAELRKEPDWDKFAYALLQHTRLLMAQKEAGDKPPQDQTGRPKP
jgi:hypothetical protein